MECDEHPWTTSNIGDFNSQSSAPPAGETTGGIQAVADFLDTDVAVIKPSGNYVKKLKAIDPTYGADVTQLQNLSYIYVGATFLAIPSAVPFLKADYPGGAYSVNGDMSVSSTATVTNTSKPAAYSLTMATTGAAAAHATGGFVDPLNETVTFPKGWALNLAVLRDEIPYPDIWNPTASGKKPIGSILLKSRDIGYVGADPSLITGSGQVYLVRSANARDLVPELELYIPSGASKIVVTGKLSGTTFPLKVTFATPLVSIGGGPPMREGTPFSKLTVSFPAKTSPYVIPSCKSAAAPVTSVTDLLGSIAPYFGDDADGNTIGLPVASTAVRIPSSRTKVRNRCRR